MQGDTQRTYCRDTLLPIWLCWTNGDPALAQVLACERQSDPPVVELRARLFAAACVTQGRSLSPGKLAALLAAQGVLYALAGLSLAHVQQVGRQAVDAADRAEFASMGETVRLASSV